jgi:hypothetical protein
MEGKTKVEIISDTNQCRIHKGAKGYIDGYIRGGNDTPYAAVVSGDTVDLVPTYALKIIK